MTTDPRCPDDLTAPAPPPTSARDVQAWILAEMARRAEVDKRVAELPPARRRCATGVSVVFSVRLDRDELAALEFIATQRKIKPSVLARNLIRTGLTVRAESGLTETVEKLERVVDELRAFVH